ncbi:restriction endonuclease subunit S [Salegentibacter mishustinae]|uniref:Type I restriction modification DNA specificity domain-containing protein n=1 Tax=Salegentibacter mishustinae TaxID=270918 RepID=A0A0Q9ZFX3_9FLAO|nr:restriction endonuclease subunit S [Salegentibacter mishustinae]KRG29026.1 hypothetical protein APR42_03615 [Salegentibacter mishustinae]PNW21922.1 hypothetical protein APB85_11875 [Salegentibacter mishustinae]PZX65274.1 type I restriction enzyme S subunit [Salegentibacter mishustinae]GGW86169.1 type I restriction endonuclease EcoKI subunit S [Salegentibacter mishustinae]
MTKELPYADLKLQFIEAINREKSNSKKKLREKFRNTDWFFDFDFSLPENWLNVNIMDVTWLVTCGVAKKPRYVDEGIPFLSAQNARPFKANLNKIKYISKEQFSKLTVGGKPELEDVLYTRVGNCGEAAKVPFEFDFAIYVSLTLIKPIHELINSDFLVAYLNSYYGRTQAHTGAIGSGLKNLNVNNVRKYRIPLPPLAEQERIVAKLDNLFSRSDKIKASLAKIPQLLQNFRQQVLAQAVTGKLTEGWREGRNFEWGFTELSKYCESSFYGPRFNKTAYSNTGYRTVRTTDMSDSGQIVISENIPKVEITDPNKLELYRVKTGDLLITRTGSIGKMARYFGSEIIIPSAYLIRFRFNENALTDFVYYSLISPQLQKEMGLNSTAITQPNLNAKKIKNLKIPDIEIEEQQEIVNRVETLFEKADKIQEKYELLKAKIEQLPQAILHKAFKGELVPQLASDGDARELLREIEGLKAESLLKKASGRRKSIKDFGKEYTLDQENQLKVAEEKETYKE